MRGSRGRSKSRGGWSPKARHPEFRPTGDQRSDALQLLALDHMKRKQREARAIMVYEWTAVAGGECSECGAEALQRFRGRPPLDLTTLPRADDLCRPCAAAYEDLGRQRKATA